MEDDAGTICRRILAAKTALQVLNVSGNQLKPGCLKDDVRKAYKKLVTVTHPDKVQAPEARTAFQRVNWAYRSLCNPESLTDGDGWQSDKKYQEVKAYKGQWYQDPSGAWYTDWDYRDAAGKWRRRTAPEVDVLQRVRKHGTDCLRSEEELDIYRRVYASSQAMEQFAKSSRPSSKPKAASQPKSTAPAQMAATGAKERDDGNASPNCVPAAMFESSATIIPTQIYRTPAPFELQDPANPYLPPPPVETSEASPMAGPARSPAEGGGPRTPSVSALTPTCVSGNRGQLDGTPKRMDAEETGPVEYIPGSWKSFVPSTAPAKMTPTEAELIDAANAQATQAFAASGAPGVLPNSQDPVAPASARLSADIASLMSARPYKVDPENASPMFHWAPQSSEQAWQAAQLHLPSSRSLPSVSTATGKSAGPYWKDSQGPALSSITAYLDHGADAIATPSPSKNGHTPRTVQKPVPAVDVGTIRGAGLARHAHPSPFPPSFVSGPASRLHSSSGVPAFRHALPPQHSGAFPPPPYLVRTAEPSPFRPLPGGLHGGIFL